MLSNIQQIYSASFQPNNIETTLHSVAKELLHSILENARQCVVPLKTETEQQLQKQQQLLERLNLSLNQAEISALKFQLETAQQATNFKINTVTNLLQAIVQQSNLPEKLRILAEQYPAKNLIFGNSRSSFQSKLMLGKPMQFSLKVPLLA